MSGRAVIARDLIQQFIDAGIVPELCTRIILELRYDDAARLYYECYASDKVLELDLARCAPEIKIVNADSAKNSRSAASSSSRYSAKRSSPRIRSALAQIRSLVLKAASALLSWLRPRGDRGRPY